MSVKVFSYQATAGAHADASYCQFHSRFAAFNCCNHHHCWLQPGIWQLACPVSLVLLSYPPACTALARPLSIHNPCINMIRHIQVDMWLRCFTLIGTCM
jgi:hypothetical protein